MKIFLLLPLFLLLAGCGCKNPITHTIQEVISCDTYLRLINVDCTVKTTDGGKRDISQHGVAVGGTFKSCK